MSPFQAKHTEHGFESFSTSPFGIVVDVLESPPRLRINLGRNGQQGRTDLRMKARINIFFFFFFFLPQS